MWLENLLTKHKKGVVAGLVGALLIIVAISVYFIVQDSMKTAKVNIYVAPTTATVKIGDKIYKTMTEEKIVPGEYEVKISADGFDAWESTIAVAEGETAEIKLFLEPTEGNENYYNDHPGDALIVGEIRAARTVAAIDKLGEANPVLNMLPFEVDFYTKNYAKRVHYMISYRVTDDLEKLVLVIKDYTGGNYEATLDKLRARGYDPEQYEIEYVDETNSGLGGKAW